MVRLKSPGMRTIKTLLIVSICFILSRLLNLRYPFYAIVAGIICTQNTVHASFNIAKNRIIGTIIGSLLGIVFVHFFSYNPWTSGIGVLILLSFLKIIKFDDAYRVACIVYLATFIPGHGAAIAYGIHRATATIAGIITALIVNLIIAPPQYADDIKKLSYDIVDLLMQSCEDFFIAGKEVNISTIGSEIFKIESLIKNYNLDIKKSNIKIIDTNYISSLVINSKKVYNHLGVINELNKDYDRFNFNEQNNYNYIYNYHIKEIMESLEKLKNLRLN